MKKIIYILGIGIYTFLKPFFISGQDISADSTVKVMFYNFENLFDPFDDSLKLDDEFLPGGSRNWTYSRMLRKIKNIYKVIAVSGEWDPPAVIGCCEVENRFVLEKLIYTTPLKKYGYRMVHRESPDPRGIDVALLYRPDMFEPVDENWIPVCPPGSFSCSRDILYVKGLLFNENPIHVFVNHWPSRYGGPAETINKRGFAADLLKNCIDSIQRAGPDANILLMGDFNDEPSDESMQFLVHSGNGDSLSLNRLINLMEYPYFKDFNQGTIKSGGTWGIFDQVIISESLLEGRNGLLIKGGSVHIIQADFLLEPDEKNLGAKPFRSFRGYFYTGGFSDHLPVMVEIKNPVVKIRQD